MKKRLIGAIVLGCLAIIFVPMLLDGEGLTSSDLVIEVPVSPLIPAIPDNQPVRPAFAIEEDLALDEPGAVSEESEGSEEIVTAPDVSASDVQPAQAEPPDRPSLDAAGLPRGWSVRLGAFGQRKNAEALEKRLLDQDYKAYTRPVSSAQGTLTAVYVGPVLTRSEANTLLGNLKTAVDIQGVVVEFSLED